VFATGSFLLRFMDGIQRIYHTGAVDSDKQTPLPPVTPRRTCEAPHTQVIIVVLELQLPRLASTMTEANMRVIEVGHRELCARYSAKIL
jgi:hypothetical protein